MQLHFELTPSQLQLQLQLQFASANTGTFAPVAKMLLVIKPGGVAGALWTEMICDEAIRPLAFRDGV